MMLMERGRGVGDFYKTKGREENNLQQQYLTETTEGMQLMLVRGEWESVHSVRYCMFTT